MTLSADTVADLHRIGAWVVVLGNGAAGLWVLAAHRWNAVRHPTMWWFVAASQVAIFVQAVLGVWLVAGDDREPGEFHMFYGFVALATVGIMYSYRTQVGARRYLLYGLGGLFLMGLGIRAMLLDA